MPISIQHRCIFVHVPKAGGTSIAMALGMHRDWRLAHLDVLHGRYFLGGRKYLLQHMPLSETVKFASLYTDVAGFFKFAFVRNPWDRLVSDFFWRSRNKGIGDFADFVHYACDCVFDRRDLEAENCHFRPQHEMLDGDVDFIGRYESYATDVEYVFDRLAVQMESLPHEYRTARSHYAKYYDWTTRRKVHDAYRQDVTRFGYEFEE